MTTKLFFIGLCTTFFGLAWASAQDGAEVKEITPLDSRVAAPVAAGGSVALPEPRKETTPATVISEVKWVVGMNAEPVPHWLAMHLPQFFDGSANAGRLGLLVTKVTPGLPAAEAHVQEGDLILAVEEIAVSSPQDMQLVLNKAAGKPVKLTLVRRGVLTNNPIRAVSQPSVTESLVASNIVGSVAINIATQQGTIAVTGNANRYKINGRFVNEKAQQVSIAVEGSLEHICGEIERLPEPLRSLVKNGLPAKPSR